MKAKARFTGPKLEYTLLDAIGRHWQCGTVQVDLNMPERLGAFYIGPDGEKHVPVMIHRAIFGSLERFTGILIENYAGHLPLWLSPVQAVVATVVSEADDYALEVAAALRGAGLRVETDLRNEKINYKVREHSVTKIPVLLVVGKREAEERTLSIRRLGSSAQNGRGSRRDGSRRWSPRRRRRICAEARRRRSARRRRRHEPGRRPALTRMTNKGRGCFATRHARPLFFGLRRWLP